MKNLVLVGANDQCTVAFEMAHESPDWWRSFGDEYDPASPHAAARAPPAPARPPAAAETDEPAEAVEDIEARVQGGASLRSLLDEQLALNRKMAAQLRAKTQLLELADEARGRMKAQLSSSAAEHAAKQQELEAALG